MTDEADRNAIADAAALWFTKHERGLTAEEEANFRSWLEADVRHLQEWTSMAETWNQLDALTSVPEWMDATHEIERKNKKRGPLLSTVATLAAAACILLSIGTVIWNQRSSSPVADSQYVIVHESESNAITLPDGSLVEARGNSLVSSEYSASVRKIQLERGEAFFTVAHDQSRPFVVQIGEFRVQAVGTAFALRRDGNDSELIVTEGRVKIHKDDSQESIYADSGSKLHLSTDKSLSINRSEKITNIEIERTLSWRSPRLEFSNASLGQVIASFKTYTNIEVIYNSDEFKNLRFSGTFNAYNFEGFLRLANSAYNIQSSSDKPQYYRLTSSF